MKPKQVYLKSVIVICLTMMVASSTLAQALVDSLSQDDGKIISSIAPYPAEMRAAILDVSQYPQSIVKLERTQARTSQSFQDLIAEYPREEQEKFYQLIRFPDLINQLVSGGRKTPEALKALLQEYPENIQQQITSTYDEHYDDVVKINDIASSSQAALSRITSKYPALVQEHFKKVIGSPDVMSLLTDNIDLTVSLGEAYKNDPIGITQQLDALSKDLNDQDSKDLAEYKSAVSSDPKLQEEMKKAADEFTTQYDQNTNNQYANSNNYYNNYPYQYWYGYPYWYSNPMWYPTPLYYQTGFYYGAGGGLVIAGFPSPFYANWFFGFGRDRYPGLYNHYNAYYNVHRTEVINRTAFVNVNNARRNTGGVSNRRTNRSAVGRTPSNSGNHNLRSTGANDGFNQYHANSFHNTGWQNMRSGGGMRGRH